MSTSGRIGRSRLINPNAQAIGDQRCKPQTQGSATQCFLAERQTSIICDEQQCGYSSEHEASREILVGPGYQIARRQLSDHHDASGKGFSDRTFGITSDFQDHNESVFVYQSSWKEQWQRNWPRLEPNTSYDGGSSGG